MNIIKNNFLYISCIILLSACNLPSTETIYDDYTDYDNDYDQMYSDEYGQENQPVTAPSLSIDIETIPLVQPDDLEYLGAFRLPDLDGEITWEYSGHGMTFYPDGDDGGENDGFPGSLFVVGHDHYLEVSEITIPQPVISSNLEDLNIAETIQPFSDIHGGMFPIQDMALPRAGIEYLPPQNDQETGKLHFTYGQHIQGFEPSHGWAELDLSDPQPVGPWVFNGYTNYATNDYIFEIPEEWADKYTPGMRLATGRFREGVWSGFGPALFAYSAWDEHSPLSPNSTLNTITPLLLYGIQNPGSTDILSDESMQMDGYQESDHWWGGAWLTAGDKSAVIFVGTKALGSSWYGFPNGVVWEYDCAEQDPPTCPDVPEWPDDNRGFWAEDYRGQIIFFDPSQLAAVATGQIESYEPQPYASLDLTQFLFAPYLENETYKRDIIGAAAFDRENGYLFMIERLADEFKSVIHVFHVNSNQ